LVALTQGRSWEYVQTKHKNEKAKKVAKLVIDVQTKTEQN